MDRASSMSEWSGPFVHVVVFGVLNVGVVGCVVQEAWL
jgi:hypothetical protein